LTNIFKNSAPCDNPAGRRVFLCLKRAESDKQNIDGRKGMNSSIEN
jgi:hypothetical protein